MKKKIITGISFAAIILLLSACTKIIPQKSIKANLYQQVIPIHLQAMNCQIRSLLIKNYLQFLMR